MEPARRCGCPSLKRLSSGPGASEAEKTVCSAFAVLASMLFGHRRRRRKRDDVWSVRDLCIANQKSVGLPTTSHTAARVYAMCSMCRPKGAPTIAWYSVVGRTSKHAVPTPCSGCNSVLIPCVGSVVPVSVRMGRVSLLRCSSSWTAGCHAQTQTCLACPATECACCTRPVSSWASWVLGTTAKSKWSDLRFHDSYDPFPF